MSTFGRKFCLELAVGVCHLGFLLLSILQECSHLIQSKAMVELLSAINNDLVHQSANGSSACCFDRLSQSKTKDSFGCSSSASKLHTCEDLNVMCMAQLLLRFLTNVLQEDAHASERNKLVQLHSVFLLVSVCLCLCLFVLV